MTLRLFLLNCLLRKPLEEGIPKHSFSWLLSARVLPCKCSLRQGMIHLCLGGLSSSLLPHVFDSWGQNLGLHEWSASVRTGGWFCTLPGRKHLESGTVAVGVNSVTAQQIDRLSLSIQMGRLKRIYILCYHPEGQGVVFPFPLIDM